MRNVWTSAGGQAAVIGLVLVGLSGCGDQAGVATSSKPSSSVPSILPSTAGPSATASPRPPATLTLGDGGIGGLALGMTTAKALATGLVGKGLADQGSSECAMFHGKRGIEYVYFVHGKVRIITVTKSIRLDTGIGVGDTYLQLHKAYRDRDIDDSTKEEARVYLPAPGAAIHAVYRVGFNSDGVFPDSKISEIALQAYDNECYE
jgi:hypothetical protein